MNTGIVEEIVCRGLIITRLRRSVPPYIAILISSLLFGAMHILAGGWILAISASIAGAIFGLIFEKAKSLLPVIAAHIAANLSEFIIISLPVPITIIRLYVAILFFALFVICLVFIVKKSVLKNS